MVQCLDHGITNDLDCVGIGKDFGSCAAWVAKQEQVSSISLPFILLSEDTQAGMKRGLEEMSAEMSGPKKTKTVSNGEAELPGEQWTKVEKKKKKKIRKVETKMDVCIIFS